VINVTIYDLLLDCYLTVTTGYRLKRADQQIDIGRRLSRAISELADGSLITFHSTVTIQSVRFGQRRQKKEPRDGHITGLLHRSMAKAEETSSDRSTNTDSRMQMQ
jgi:hypothetical protein